MTSTGIQQGSPLTSLAPPAPAPAPAPVPRRLAYGKLFPGVAAAVIVGGVAFAAARLTPALSPLIWAVVLGAVFANLNVLPRALAPGITFSAKQLLRLAVGFLGLRLALSEVLAVGAEGLAVIGAAVVATFIFTRWLSHRFALSRSLGALLAAGTSICGAAAIVAMAGAVEAKEEETAVSVGAVTLYGTLSMLLFPLFGAALGFSAEQFGLWAGASIHEVAQVVGASFSFDAASASASASASTSAELATVVKLGRVLTLAPMAIVMTVLYRRAKARAGAAAGGKTSRVPLVPWFIVVFIVAMGVRSLGVLPESTVSALIQADTFLLAVAMAGLGLDLKWAKVRAAGLKPLYVTGIATVFISLLTLGLVFAST